MIRFLVGRVVSGLIGLWFAASVAFVLAHSAPGGPAMALGGEYGAPGLLDEVTRAYGLDRPLVVVYRDWLLRLAVFDLGTSYRSQTPVVSLIAERAPTTLALMIPAIALGTLAGLFAGLLAASTAKPQPPIVAALGALAAIPSYVVAHAMILLFAVGLGWLPVQGISDAHAGPRDGWQSIIGTAQHLVLPVLSLGLVQLSLVALVVRARLLEEMRRPYVVTASAKGLSRWRVLTRHALPNVTTPILTLVGWRLGALMGGAVVVETVFALPGLGRLAVTSAIARDHPTVIGVVLLACAIMILASTAVDGIVRWIDPRIEDERP